MYCFFSKEYLDKYLISSCHEDTLMDNFVDWLQTVVVVRSHFAIQKSIRDFWLVLYDEIQIKAFLTKIWMIAIFSVDEWTIFYVMQKDQGQLKHILDLYVFFFFFFSFLHNQRKQYYQEQPYKLYGRMDQDLEQRLIKICSVWQTAICHETLPSTNPNQKSW